MAKVKIIKGTEAAEMAHEMSVADSYLDEQGRELCNGVPVAPPVGYKKQKSLHEQIRDMIRSEKLAQEAAQGGYETFEESDDFDIEDDDPRSPYEAEFEGDLIPPPPASPPPADGQAQPAPPAAEGKA